MSLSRFPRARRNSSKAANTVFRSAGSFPPSAGKTSPSARSLLCKALSARCSPGDHVHAPFGDSRSCSSIITLLSNAGVSGAPTQLKAPSDDGDWRVRCTPRFGLLVSAHYRRALLCHHRFYFVSVVSRGLRRRASEGSSHRKIAHHRRIPNTTDAVRMTMPANLPLAPHMSVSTRAAIIAPPHATSRSINVRPASPCLSEFMRLFKVAELVIPQNCVARIPLRRSQRSTVEGTGPGANHTRPDAHLA